jgi:ABC-type multidrug transport system ATPase subunit
MKLEIKNLKKNYGKKSALCGIDVSLDAGIYGILGENGAGKSTLLNILTDNLPRTSGTILYNGTDIEKLGKKYRRELGYMPQQQGLYEQFTAQAFLRYMASLKEVPKKQAKSQIAELLAKVNLEDVARKKIGGFSGGMKQRLLLAQALLGDPKIIILDEPTAGLDPKERIRMRNFIAELSKDKIVIFATHIVSDIECIADYVILLHGGKVIRQDTPTNLIDEVTNHIYEMKCDKNQIDIVRSRYPYGNVLQKRDGLVYRIAEDKEPEGFVQANDDINLEDVYMYHIGRWI